VPLRIQDNGCGIPSEHINRLFEPFFTTKEVGKGTGLGLSMVFGAIQRHQGCVEVESVEGQGTTVHIYIPLLIAAQPTRHIKQESVLTSEEGRQEVILLVDDEALILDMGTEVLEVLGYHVLQACNGFEAVEVYKANQEHISLIITDVVMPKLGGVEAIKRIRCIQPDVKVIFSSGYDRNAIGNKELSLHNDAFIGKPYAIDELSKLIRQKLHESV